MELNVEVLLTPADCQARQVRGFTGEVCVVLDVLRATSVMVTGLANGARGFVPVEEIAEAVTLRRQMPGALLAGEREGLRITAAQSGGVDFDLGNSPREYVTARVAERTIISTTTNGTRALRSCASAQAVAVGSFLNLTATANWLLRQKAHHLALVCAGTGDAAALEDILCAGAFCDQLVTATNRVTLADSAEVALRVYRTAAADLFSAAGASQNGRRLLANPELGGDVAFCLQRDILPLVALLGRDGVVRSQVV
jgi:2-phosphosulfolactate phosphatase